MKDTFTQFIRLGIAILLLAMVLYWVDATWYAPDRLPTCVQANLPANRICLETVHNQYNNKAVWIDARSASDYEIHRLILSDAPVYPIRKGPDMAHQIDAAIASMLEAADTGACIVIFCKGDCTASEEIAAELRNLGIIEAPIYTLEGGWDALKADGMLLP